MLINTEWVEVEEITLELNNQGDTFGIGISGGKASGATVRMITKNGIADQNGRLCVGDHILALNDYHLKGMNSGLAAKLIRNAKKSLTLLVVRPIRDVIGRSVKDKLVLRTRCLRDPVVKVKELADEFHRQVISNGYIFFSVTLDKGFEELGITAARLITELKDQSTGIFVTAIEKGKIIEIDGRIQVGDEITEVNGVKLHNSSIECAAQLLSQNTHVLRLNVKRHLQSDICNNLASVIGNGDPGESSYPQKMLTYSINTTHNDKKYDESQSIHNDTQSNENANENSEVVSDKDEIRSPDISALTSMTSYNHGHLTEDKRENHPLLLSRSRSLGAIYCRRLSSQKLKRCCSMQIDSGFAMWDDKIYKIVTRKPEHEGLGFSLLGYPTRVDRSCLVVRSIVPGGLLHREQQINTGDRLISVNGHDVELLSFDDTIKLLQELPVNEDIELDVLKPRNYILPLSRESKASCSTRSNNYDQEAVIAFSTPAIVASQMFTLRSSLQLCRLQSVSEEEKSEECQSLIKELSKNVMEPEQIQQTRTSSDEKAHPDVGNDHPTIEDTNLNPQELPEHCLFGATTTRISVTDTYSVMKVKMLGMNQPIRSTSTGYCSQFNHHDPIQNNYGEELIPIVLLHRKHSRSRRRIASSSHKDECISSEYFFSKNSYHYKPNKRYTNSRFERISSSQEDRRSDQMRKERQSYPCTTVTTFLHRDVIKFPVQLEKHIQLRQMQRKLGITLDTGMHEGVNGCIVTSVIPGGAAERDGRLFVNDYIVSINNECMRKISPGTAKSIIRRASLLHDYIEITYMSHKDTQLFEEHFVRTVREVTTTKSLCALPTSSDDCIKQFIDPHHGAAIRVYSEEQLSSKFGKQFEIPLYLIWKQIDQVFGVKREHVNRQGGIYLVDGFLDLKNVYPQGQNVYGIFVKDVSEDYIDNPQTGDLITKIDDTDIKPGMSLSSVIDTSNKQAGILTLTFHRLHKPLRIIFNPHIHTIVTVDTFRTRDQIIGELITIDDKTIQNEEDMPTNIAFPALSDESVNSICTDGEQNIATTRLSSNVNIESCECLLYSEKYGHLPGRLLLISVTREMADEPIGLSLVNYNSPECCGILISSIFPGSLASKCGQFNVGDQVLEINGNVQKQRRRLKSMTPMLKQFKTLSVTFLIHRSQELVDWLATQTHLDNLARQKLIKTVDSFKDVSDDTVDQLSSPPISNKTNGIYGDHVNALPQQVSSHEEHESIDLTNAMMLGSTEAQQMGCKQKNTFNNLRSHSGKTRVSRFDTNVQPHVPKAKLLEAEKVGTVTPVATIKHAVLGTDTFEDRNKGLDLPHVSMLIRSHLTDPNDPKIRPVLIGVSSVIEIDRDDSPSLGMSIVGGFESHLGSILIHSIFNDGPVHKDGRLAVGDQILEVDKISVHNLTCEDVLDLIVHIIGPVRFKVIRSPGMLSSLDDTQERLNKITVDLNKKPGKGFGFSIMSRQNGIGAFVSSVIEGGCAEKDGRLMPGDFLIELNGRQVFKMVYDDIVYLLKTSPPGKFHMIVGRFKPYQTTFPSTSHRTIFTSDQSNRSVPLLKISNAHSVPCATIACSRILTKRTATPNLSQQRRRSEHKRSQSAPQRLNQQFSMRKNSDKSKSLSVWLLDV